jgi:hypothetical protein
LSAVLAGFFPTSVTFRGGFRYANTEQLDAALAAIQALIDGEDDDLASELELKRKGCELRVRVDTTCARDEYLAYETLIETLGSFAIEGEVVGEIDDTITTYGAGSAAASPRESADDAPPPISKAAGLVWIPLFACEPLIDLAGLV